MVIRWIWLKYLNPNLQERKCKGAQNRNTPSCVSQVLSVNATTTFTRYFPNTLYFISLYILSTPQHYLITLVCFLADYMLHRSQRSTFFINLSYCQSNKNKKQPLISVIRKKGHIIFKHTCKYTVCLIYFYLYFR